MATEKVRLASIALGPLLRRRGTSPAVGATQRRAIQALDKALVENDPRKQEDAIRLATAELRNCQHLAEQSSREADRGQLDGVNQALILIAPATAPAPPRSSVFLAPSPAPASEILHPPGQPVAPFKLVPPPIPPQARPAPLAASPTAEARIRTPKTKSLDFPTARVRLDGLLKGVRVIHVRLDDPLTTLREVSVAGLELDKIVQVTKWLGAKHIPAFLEAAEKAENVEERLVAHAALVHLGVPDGAEKMITMVAKAAMDKPPGTTATILRTLANAGVLDGLVKLFLGRPEIALCKVLLPVLWENGLLSSDQLLNLANHPDDEVSAEAAVALAWAGDARGAQMLLAWARATSDPRRANAFLFAAVALGLVEALAEVRARLTECKDSVHGAHHLIEALAIAGDGSDAVRLVAFAARPEAEVDVDVGQAVLAAANLGCAEILPSLSAFAERVRPDILTEARSMILGDGRSHHPGTIPSPSTTRMLRGQPWSVAGVLESLAALDRPVWSQRRSALEIRVRTGLVPPTGFPLLASAAARAELLAKWETHFAKAGAKLAPGGWYYQGKPARSAGGIR